MTTKKSDAVDLAGAGQKLLAHSKSVGFSARRGLALEMFPFIYAAGERMSARAISDFLAKEQGIQLSSVTVNKALKAPHENWNLYFDMIEPYGRIFAKSERMSLADFLFQKQYFYNQVDNPLVQAAARFLVKAEIAKAAAVLRSKWFSIDWEIRLKARQFLEHRLGDGKAK